MTGNTKHPRVRGNQLYIICTVCGPEIANALLLGMRDEGAYEGAPAPRAAEKFFSRHETCGGTRDHYKLAMGHPADWDALEFVDPASDIRGAVKLALVKS
jgi:hypothetical protein